MAAGTAHSNHQLALALCAVQGIHIIDQVNPPADEPLGLLPLHHIVPHRRFQSGVVAQFFNIIGIGQTANVKHQVCLGGNAIFEPEADTLHHQRVAGIFQKQVGNPAFQLGGGQKGGVDNIIGPLPHRLEHFPLQLHRLFHRPLIGFRQRMTAAVFLIAVKQHLIFRVQKQDFVIHLIGLHIVQHVKERGKHLASSGIGDNGHTAALLLGGKAQLVKGGNQLGRQIIHTEKADILHRVHGPGFSRPGQSRNNYKIHDPSLSFLRLIGEISIPRRRALHIPAKRRFPAERFPESVQSAPVHPGRSRRRYSQ